MTKRIGISIAILLAILAILGYWASRPAPGHGNGKLIDVQDTIQGDSSTGCTLTTMPLPLNTGDTVTWVDDKGTTFTITFPQGNALNPGTPFTNSLTGARQTTFASGNGAPVKTGGASMTYWQQWWDENEFPIQTISVNGNTCYDKDKNHIEGMKVIVN